TSPRAGALEVPGLERGQCLRGGSESNSQIHHARPVYGLRIFAALAVRPAISNRFYRHAQPAQAPKKSLAFGPSATDERKLIPEVCHARRRPSPLWMIPFWKIVNWQAAVRVPVHHCPYIREIQIETPRPLLIVSVVLGK